VTVNPFKSDPEKKLARDLDAARVNQNRLVERSKAAELMVSERRAEAQRLARDGANDSELDAAEAALRSAQDRRSTLAAALVDVERQVQDLERAQDDLADRKLRAESAAIIEKLTLEVAEAATAFDAGAEKLAECTARAAAIITDAKGLETFATRARTEVSGAVAMISAMLRSRASEVLSGSAPPGLPKPEGPTPLKPRPASIPTKQIFALENLKWTNAAGAVEKMAKYMIGEVPVALAERAISQNWADEPASARAQQMIAAFGGGWRDVRADSCIDLDTGQRPEMKSGRGGRYRGALDGLATSVTKEPAVAVTGTATIARLVPEDRK
jgi:hypothetical protein